MATRHRGPPEESRALDAFVKLVRASDSVASRAHEHLAAEDLTVSQFGVLEALHHLGPLCQRDLAAKLLRSGGDITMVVRNLERRGLVRRERAEGNRRFVTVRLTPEGTRTIRRVFPRHVAAVARELGVLSAREQEDLARLCRAVGRGEGTR